MTDIAEQLPATGLGVGDTVGVAGCRAQGAGRARGSLFRSPGAGVTRYTLG